ncbi:MAG TPA: hypothetical protein DCG75_04715 [Bacteroidales bacterium]|jgi:hypothetical protein|nr:hypothetical protein [Bacteroidales bacterium]
MFETNPINEMRNFLVIFLIFSSITLAKSQSVHDSGPEPSLTIEPFTQKQVQISKVNYFLNEDWQGGLIQLKDDRNVNGYLYRYNIFTDQIELRTVVDPSPVEIISIGVQKFIHSDFLVNEESISSGYFELIVNGDCKLLLRRYIRSNEQDYRVSKILGSSSAAPASTVMKEYYIKKGTEPAVLIDKSKETLLNYLSDKESFKEFLDKKFLLFINENKLIELINYYNKI